MAKVFISYSRQDLAIKDDLSDKLTRLGHQVIFAEGMAESDKNLAGSITGAKHEADGSIIILTNNSIRSSQVIKEFKEAEMMVSTEGKFLIPIVAEQVELPDFVRNVEYLMIKDAGLLEKIQQIVTEAISKGDRGSGTLSSGRTVRRAASKKGVSSPINYWFLKLNPKTWNLIDFQKYYDNNDEAFFGTHNLDNDKRVDYDYFFQVKNGDKAIGYAFGDKRAAACIFEVTKSVHVRTDVGEVIELRIEKVFNPSIPIEFFASQLPFRYKLEAEDPERIFPITSAIFDAIVASDQLGYTTREGYITNYTTEGDHSSIIGKHSFAADIASFGAVICLKKVKPPLAIGLFGKWGSGKSFFMEKLANHIDKLIVIDDQRYVKHVVQVKFNSWHYSDANLWASLITELFDSLNIYANKLEKVNEIEKLSAALQLTSLHKGEVEQIKKELDAKVNELREKQSEKRARLEDLSGLKFLKLLFLDPKVKRDIENLNNDGLEAIKENQEKLTSYIQELDSSWGRVKLFFIQLITLKGRRWSWLALSAFIVFILTYLVGTGFALEWQELTLWLSVKMGIIVSLVGKVAEAVRSHRKLFDKVQERWLTLKKTFDDRPLEQNAELDAHERELIEVTNSLKAIDLKISQTKKEIEEISNGKKLMEFIGQKSKDEGYSKQLGLIASIRRDFQTLDHLLRAQYDVNDAKKDRVDNPENVQLRIDRIVLYIDDLDRCNEEIVVRVLEAIHLLLAFPLFVVVVGVDPRWLNNALNKKYNKFFSANGSRSTQESITSYDYLEKIFQIPFNLRGATKSDRQRLLRHLTQEEVVKEERASEELSSQQDNLKLTDNPRPSSTSTAPTLLSAEDETGVLNKVEFKEDEITYMENISGMFGQTPRMMNRYVNIYRIIKSHKNYQVSHVPSARDYKSTMFVLGIIVGCPTHAKQFIELLGTTRQEKMVDFIEELNNSDLRMFIVENTDKDAVDDLSISMVKKNLSLISRFSFRTYEIDELMTNE